MAGLRVLKATPVSRETLTPSAFFIIRCTLFLKEINKPAEKRRFNAVKVYQIRFLLKTAAISVCLTFRLEINETPNGIKNKIRDVSRKDQADTARGLKPS